MSLRRFSLLIAVVACAAAAPAGRAAAATAVNAGPGTQPRVAVDAAGAGYLSWVDGSGSTLRYCKLPATTTACTAAFSYTDEGIDRANVLLAPGGRVLLVAVHGPQVPVRPKALWTSTDAGASFGPPVQIAGVSATGGNIGGGALHLPAGTLGLPAEAILTIGELTASAMFQASATTPSADNASADLTPSVDADIALQDGVLLAALSDFNTLSWTRYVGPVPATTASLNAAANWSAPALIGPRFAATLDTRLASGPGGAWVGYVAPGTTGRNPLVVRRFSGSGWGAATTVAGSPSAMDLYEDPSGRLHALWTEAGALRYRSTTNAANTAWGSVQTLATGDNFAFPRLAVNADGNGWAAWAGNGGVVRALPLHGTYTGPQTRVQTSGFGADYTLNGIPRSCVRPGQQFRVTLSWRRQRRKGNLFVKVRRTDFYLGTRRLRIDTTVPFVYTYAVRVTQPRGSTIRLRARAFIKVRHGRSPKKSIFARVRVCS